jgi:hypothetical protein
MKEKFKRQDSIPELEFHASGHAIHTGKISTGCRICFSAEQGGGVFFGTACQFNCPMCYYDINRKEQSQEEMDKTIEEEIELYNDKSYNPLAISYVSDGETLLYISELIKAAKIHDEIEKDRNIKIHRHLYTNGVLAKPDILKILKKMHIDEIRFHISASGFSETVFENMISAKKMGFVVTVEEPSWPPHKEKLFSILPRLEEIGITHLNLVEVQITEHNKKRIEKAYPEARYYKDYFYHIYDEGLAYDIIEEKIKQKYSFSVLDCNSGVERSRNGQFQHIGFDPSTIENMTRDFDFYSMRDSYE